MQSFLTNQKNCFHLALMRRMWLAAIMYIYCGKKLRENVKYNIIVYSIKVSK